MQNKVTHHLHTFQNESHSDSTYIEEPGCYAVACAQLFEFIRLIFLQTDTQQIITMSQY